MYRHKRTEADVVEKPYAKISNKVPSSLALNLYDERPYPNQARINESTYKDPAVCLYTKILFSLSSVSIVIPRFELKVR